MEKSEAEKFLAVHSIGPTMVRYFDAIGMSRLADFKDQDAGEIAFRIDVYLGVKRMNRLGIAAIQNVIDAANRAADGSIKRT